MLNNYSKLPLEVGCDEAGRGSLAGPVFAAAVILPEDFYHDKLNDSKKLREKDRIILRDIIEKNAVAFSVASVNEEEIDRINILNASILAMHKALSKLSVIPDHILVDGNRFKPYKSISHICIVGGDSKYASIAAASILAKTYRDDFMIALSHKYPEYGWAQNKGYGTLKHRNVLLELGPTKFHRKSFSVKNQISAVQTP